MRCRLLVLCCTFLSFAGTALAQGPVAAFVDVNVIPMDREHVLAHQTVLVRGDRVVALGPTAKTQVPAGARRIDGRGKYLIPGLADMHAHVNDKQEQLFLFLANGVTTVRDMFGRPATLALRDRVATGALLGPRIYTAGLDEECPKDQPLAACLAAMKAAGIIMVKIYWDSLPRFDSVVAIARQLHLPVGGHVSTFVGLGPALAAPYATLEHLWGYFEYLVGTRPSLMLDLIHINKDSALRADLDTASWGRPGWRPDPQKLKAVAAATRRAGTWNAPTLVVAERLACSQPSLSETPVERIPRTIFELKFPLVKALQDGGAGLLLSTDDVAGFAVHRELELLVHAGLTPYQALATGTRNVAAYLGTADSTGTVAVGKRADLVLLDGNPLRDIRYTAGPAGVMVGGRWLSRAALDAGFDSVMAARGKDRDRDERRMYQEASQHRGVRLFLWSTDSAPPRLRTTSNAFNESDDICHRLRAAPQVR